MTDTNITKLNTDESPESPISPPPKETEIHWSKLFLGVALFSALYGVLVSTQTLARLDRAIAEAKEAARPASIQLIQIIAPDCRDCFNLDEAVAALKKQNVSVSDERILLLDSPESRALIEKLGIQRVPTYVFTGEVNKKGLESFVRTNGEVKDETFVFTKVLPPFVDAVTGKEQGKVHVTYLTDAACPQCIDPSLTVEAYKQAGVYIAEERKVVWDSAEGQKIIGQYAIEKAPTFLLSSDVAFYESVRSAWQGIGSVEQDGTYVARQIPLPYRDVSKRHIVGLVDVVYLVDTSCSECYKPQTVQRNILMRGFGVGIRSERTVDVNAAEGKALVRKYTITQVPTIFLSPDAGEYPWLKAVWPQVGTVETDGWHVFRNIRQLRVVIYKDLTTNQIVRPPQESSSEN